MRLDISKHSQVLACMAFRASLFERIKERQYDDPHFLVLKDIVRHDDAKEVSIGDDGVLWIQARNCVPTVYGLRELILEEAHSSSYSVHPGVAKDMPHACVPTPFRYWRICHMLVLWISGVLGVSFYRLLSFSTAIATNRVFICLLMRPYMGGSFILQLIGSCEARLLGTDLVQDALERVKLIEYRLLTT